MLGSFLDLFYDCSMKTLLILILLFPLFAHAFPEDNVKVFGRIRNTGDSLTLVRSREGDAIPCMLNDPELKETISNLNPGDEVLAEGYISYLSTTIEGEMRPVFIISSLKPISLARLGDVNRGEISEPRAFYPGPGKVYSPMAIPVSAQVATSITMTGSALLLQSLTAGPHPDVRHELNSGLLLFAGIMATGLFIFEQMIGVETQGVSH